MELEERAEREKKLQDEVFRLGEVASRQAEALEAKNAELLPLREAKASTLPCRPPSRRGGARTRLNHEVKTLRKASEAAEEMPHRPSRISSSRWRRCKPN